MIKKAFVDPQGMVGWTCPGCGRWERVAAEGFKTVKGPVSFTCPSCGKAYQLEIEFRKAFRKATFLDGICFPLADPGRRMRIVVRDLSLEGCNFENLEGYPFRTEEKIHIEFVLDDSKRTRIKKQAVVRRISAARIGCRFQEPPGVYDPDLGFYLKK